jgi:hypothetical protein
MALACCALLSQHDCCAADIGTTEFLGSMQNMARGRGLHSSMSAQPEPFVTQNTP